MKLFKITSWFLCFSFLCLNTTGCVDQFANKRPSSFPNTKWMSSDPNIYFSVDEDNGCCGEMETIQGVVAIELIFSQGPPQVGIYHKKERDYIVAGEEIFSGTCRFGDSEFTININDDTTDIFGQNIKKIIFIKEDESRPSG